MTIHGTKYVLFGSNKQGLDRLELFLYNNYFKNSGIEDLGEVFFRLDQAEEKNDNEDLQKFCKANYIAFLTADTDDTSYTAFAVQQYIKYAYAYTIIPNQIVTNENQAEYKEQFETRFKGDLFNYAKWVKLKDGIPTGRINTGYLHTLLKSCINYIVVTERGNNNGIFYVYENGVYNRTGDLTIKAFIKTFIPDGIISTSALNGVVELLKADEDKLIDFKDLNNNEFIINFKNGLYDVKTRQLKPHTPDIYTSIQLPVNLPSEETATPNFDRFIKMLCSDDENIVDPEKIQVILEYIGITISNLNVGRRFKKCLCLMSRIGNTGKSVLLNVISSLVGTENTINISIQNMCDRFSGGDLYGKRAIICGDQSAEPIQDSSKFKQITGGDVIKAELKGIQSFNIVFSGAFLFACNDLPTFKDDKGLHIFERFEIIKCERYLQPDERDRTLTYKLLEELDGIAYKCVKALHTAIDNGYNLSPCLSSDTEIKEYQKGNDPMAYFIDECLEVTHNPKDRIRKTLTENTYVMWRDKKGFTQIKKTGIQGRLQKNGISCKQYAGNFYYTGVKFKLYSVEEVKDIKALPKEFWDSLDDEE